VPIVRRATRSDRRRPGVTAHRRSSGGAAESRSYWGCRVRAKGSRGAMTGVASIDPQDGRRGSFHARAVVQADDRLHHRKRRLPRALRRHLDSCARRPWSVQAGGSGVDADRLCVGRSRISACRCARLAFGELRAPGGSPGRARRGRVCPGAEVSSDVIAVPETAPVS
jgi:hypothetical protein